MKTKSKEYLYPKNLIADLVGNFKESTWQLLNEKDLNEDRINGLNYALSQCSENEQLAIALRYKGYCALAEIGEQLGVTKERARQIIAEALRKMRHPKRFGYVQYGYNAYSEAKEKQAQEILACQKFDEENNARHILDGEKDIWELNFSVRAYNALKRAGKNTVSDIWDLTEEDLIEIRNLGKKTIEEILTKIHYLKENCEKTNAKRPVVHSVETHLVEAGVKKSSLDTKIAKDIAEKVAEKIRKKLSFSNNIDAESLYKTIALNNFDAKIDTFVESIIADAKNN